MLLLTGRLKWLNVLRITKLTENQSIPYDFSSQANEDFLQAVEVGLEFCFIRHVLRLQHHRKMIL